MIYKAENKMIIIFPSFNCLPLVHIVQIFTFEQIF